MPTVGALAGIYLAEEEFAAPTNADEARALATNGLYPRFFHGMLERGVALAPGAYEILFTSLAHSDADLARTAEAAFEVARAMHP